jgi:hypothetical protein
LTSVFEPVLNTVKVVCPKFPSPTQQWLCKWLHSSWGYDCASWNQSWFKCGILACINNECLHISWARLTQLIELYLRFWGL